MKSCQETTGVRGPWSKLSLESLFSRNTEDLVHSSKSFYCLSPGLTREGPRNAEIAHQAQLVPKLIFLFNEPSLALSKVSTIIAILGCQLKGYFNIQDLLRYLYKLPRGVMQVEEPRTILQGNMSPTPVVNTIQNFVEICGQGWAQEWICLIQGEWW